MHPLSTASSLPWCSTDAARKKATVWRRVMWPDPAAARPMNAGQSASWFQVWAGPDSYQVELPIHRLRRDRDDRRHRLWKGVRHSCKRSSAHRISCSNVPVRAGSYAISHLCRSMHRRPTELRPGSPEVHRAARTEQPLAEADQRLEQRLLSRRLSEGGAHGWCGEDPSLSIRGRWRYGRDAKTARPCRPGSGRHRLRDDQPQPLRERRCRRSYRHSADATGRGFCSCAIERWAPHDILRS